MAGIEDVQMAESQEQCVAQDSVERAVAEVLAAGGYG